MKTGEQDPGVWRESYDGSSGRSSSSSRWGREKENECMCRVWVERVRKRGD